MIVFQRVLDAIVGHESNTGFERVAKDERGGTRVEAAKATGREGVTEDGEWCWLRRIEWKVKVKHKDIESEREGG